jgi:hypothetical protein
LRTLVWECSHTLLGACRPHGRRTPKGGLAQRAAKRGTGADRAFLATKSLAGGYGRPKAGEGTLGHVRWTKPGSRGGSQARSPLRRSAIRKGRTPKETPAQRRGPARKGVFRGIENQAAADSDERHPDKFLR